MMQRNMYKRKVAFVPYCLLAPGFQANAHVQGNYGWNTEFLNILSEYEIDIVPYLCTETTFYRNANGLLREKHGLSYYQTIKGYSEYCAERASNEFDKMMQMVECGYKIITIMGIEHSPSCAVNYLYTNMGTQKRPGIFMKSLMELLEQNDMKITYIGINRKYPKKALEKLKECIDNF